MPFRCTLFALACAAAALAAEPVPAVRLGQPLPFRGGHKSPVCHLAVSRDGKRAASGSYDRTIRIWNTEDGEELRKIEMPARGPNPVAFTPDGRFLVGGDAEGAVRVFDVATGAELRRTPSLAERVLCVDVSPDGRTLVAGAYNTTFQICEVSTGRVLAGGRAAAPIEAVAFDRDGKRIAVGVAYMVSPYSAKLVDAATGQDIRELTGGDPELGSTNTYRVAFSPDGARVLAGGITHRVWDAGTGNLIQAITGESTRDWIGMTLLAPEARYLLDGGARSSLRLRDLAKSPRPVPTKDENGRPLDAEERLERGRELAKQDEADRTLQDLSVVEYGEVWALASDAAGQWALSGHKSGSVVRWPIVRSERR